MAALTIARAIFPTVVSVGAWANGVEQNFRTPDPKEVASVVFVSANGISATFDIGSAQAIDTFFAGFLTGLPNGSTVQLQSVTDINGSGPVTVGVANISDLSRSRVHAFARIPAPVTSRYWRFIFSVPSATTMTIGILAVGKSVQPLYGREWGSGRTPIDLSAVQSLRGGGFGIERAARKALYEFTCPDLTDAELAELWDIAAEVGESAPVIVAEDPAAVGAELGRGLHYGIFRRPEAYRRLIPGASSWAFRVEEWV